LIQVENEWLHKGNHADEKAMLEEAANSEAGIGALNILSDRLFKNWLEI
jgi:hypothetical protein